MPGLTAVPTVELRTEDSGAENLIRETYYDHAGNKTTGPEGFVTRLRTVSSGKTIAVSWLDENGAPVPIMDDTYYRVEYTYDKMGNINREKYYDENGNPVQCSKGYSIVYREFDEYNRVEYEKFFDTDGFAIMLEDGAVSYRYLYDEDGKLIKTTKYDYADHEVE